MQKQCKTLVLGATFAGRLTEFCGAPKGSILEERVSGLREWVERFACD